MFDTLTEVEQYIYGLLTAELDVLCFDDDDEDFYNARSAELASKAWKELSNGSNAVDEDELVHWFHSL